MARSSKKNKGCLSFLFGLGSDDRDDQAVETVPGDVKGKEPFPFRLRDDFLSTAEYSFYMVLKSMMGTYFTICPKVSLSDIFFVTNPDRNMSAYNKINRKHVDFLICDAETMKPRFAIELDDKSHNRQDRLERDEFVEELFETANLPLVRIPVRQTYNTGELGVLFREAMAEKPKIPTGQPFTVDPEAELACPAQFSSAGVEAAGLPSTGSGSGSKGPATGTPTNIAPFCPKCGQQMVLRTAENGANKGKKFWGCVNYPKCTMIIRIE